MRVAHASAVAVAVLLLAAACTGGSRFDLSAGTNVEASRICVEHGLRWARVDSESNSVRCYARERNGTFDAEAVLTDLTELRIERGEVRP